MDFGLDTASQGWLWVVSARSRTVPSLDNGLEMAAEMAEAEGINAKTLIIDDNGAVS